MIGAGPATIALALAALFAAMPALAVDLNDKSAASLKAQFEQESAAVPTFSEGSLELAYSANSDLNEPASPPRVANGIEATFSVNLLKQATVFVGTDLRYSTYGSEIQVDNDGPALGDVSAGAYRMFALDSRNALLTVATIDVPTSPASRREGYVAVGQLVARSMSTVWAPWIRVDNTVGVDYVGNRFELSPTSLEENPDLGGFYSLGVYLRLFKGFRVGASAGAKATRYLDGSTLMAFNNAQSLWYVNGDWSARLILAHGDWIDRRAIDFWYVDRYRENVTLRVAYAF